MPYASKERQRAACRQHYLDHKPAYIDRARAHTKGMQVQIAAFLAAHLEDHPCVDCGEADPIVLEFDHRARSDKRFNVSDMRYGRTSLATVKAEVAKCDVRCANCHRRKTYRERQDADGTLGRPEPSVLSLFGSMPG